MADSAPDYVPPMPDPPKAAAGAAARKRPAAKKPSKDPATPADFPRSTPDDEARFAKGFGGAEREEKSSTKAAPKRSRATASGKLESKLEELFSALSLPFLLAGDTHCAEIVAKGAPGMAHAWVNLAEENPGVKRVLLRITETSAWGGVILATAGVAVPIMAHHNVLPAAFAGILGGPSSSPRANGAHPSPAPEGGSAMGAPTFAKDPVPQGASPDYVPTDPLRTPDMPAGVVTVGTRNRATMNPAATQ